MRDAEINRVLDLLFEAANPKLIPPRKIWAILDGARDPKVHRLVQSAELPKVCLYRGEIDPELAANAPWLLELARDDETTRDLIIDGWGKSWGLFVDAALPEAALHRHLRTFLKVTDEDARKLIFRYYDPRVFRTYAETANAEEAKTITGAIHRWLCESDGGGEVLAYKPSATGFAMTRTTI